MSGVAGVRRSIDRRVTESTNIEGRPGIMQAALFGLCPQCGAKTLFSGPARFAERCQLRARLWQLQRGRRTRCAADTWHWRDDHRACDHGRCRDQAAFLGPCADLGAGCHSDDESDRCASPRPRCWRPNIAAMPVKQAGMISHEQVAADTYDPGRAGCGDDGRARYLAVAAQRREGGVSGTV